jgi:iron uptake system component EfeO
MRYKRSMGRHGEDAIKRACLVMVVGAVASSACTDKTDADYRQDVDVAIRDSISGDIKDLIQAARELQAAAPNRAWSATRNGADIQAMRDAWKRTRIAYEHVEGAVKAVFRDVDVKLDARYEESLSTPDGTGDKYLFDGRGVVGMHAVERILFSPEIRREVTVFESSLPGYRPASYPTTDNDAIAFKTGLVQQLIDDGDTLLKQLQNANVDASAAYQGLVGLMIEQKEKVNLAVTGADESRYSNVTLFDLRNNLDGTKKIYDLFRDWVRSKNAGQTADSKMQTNFVQLGDTYGTTDEALPTVPIGWSSDSPSADDLSTPFGTMWQRVHQSVDPYNDTSVVFVMNEIATLLGIQALITQ